MFGIKQALKLHAMTIIIRSVFKEGLLNFIQKFFLMTLCMNYNTKKKKELTLIKQVHQKNVYFISIGTLKMLDLSLNNTFVINVMMF